VHLPARVLRRHDGLDDDRQNGLRVAATPATLAAR
jgi:hypothetical protein